LFLGLVGWAAEMRDRHLGPLSLPFYFLAINTALLVAWIKLLFRYRPHAAWDRAPRK
jgi:hypothetical protein